MGSKRVLYCRLDRRVEPWPSDYWLATVTAFAQWFGISRRKARRWLDRGVERGLLGRWPKCRHEWAKLDPEPRCHPECGICFAYRARQGLEPKSGSGCQLVSITPHIPPDWREWESTNGA